MAKNIDAMEKTIEYIENMIFDGTLDNVHVCPIEVTKLGTLQSLSKAIWAYAQSELGYVPSGTYEYYQTAWYELTLDYVESRWGKKRIIDEILPLAYYQQEKQKDRIGVYLTQAGRWAKWTIERYDSTHAQKDLLTSVKIKKYHNDLVNKHEGDSYHIWTTLDGHPLISKEEARRRLTESNPAPTKKGKKKKEAL